MRTGSRWHRMPGRPGKAVRCDGTKSVGKEEMSLSVLVAIRKNGRVYMGCDSQMTMGGTASTLGNPNNYKIWKVRGAENCLMGSVGAVRDACVIRTMDDLVTDYNVYSGHVCYDFVVNKMVPDIIARLEKSRYIKDDGVFNSMESDFLFAFRDRLYLISGDTSVVEVEDYVAVGSGKRLAMGSLLSTEGEWPEARIVKAVKASAAADVYVDYPIILTDTMTTEFAVVTEKNERSFMRTGKERK